LAHFDHAHARLKCHPNKTQKVKFVKEADPKYPGTYRATSGSRCTVCGKGDQVIAKECKEKMVAEHKASGGKNHAKGFVCDCEECLKHRPS
jgi:hypothetical protein